MSTPVTERRADGMTPAQRFAAAILWVTVACLAILPLIASGALLEEAAQPYDAVSLGSQKFDATKTGGKNRSSETGALRGSLLHP